MMENRRCDLKKYCNDKCDGFGMKIFIYQGRIKELPCDQYMSKEIKSERIKLGLEKKI
jgi:hypothetical protein